MLEDGQRRDRPPAPGAVADAREPVDELAEPLLRRPGPGRRLGEAEEGALLVGDVRQGLEEDDGLVEAALLLGLEEDQGGV